MDEIEIKEHAVVRYIQRTNNYQKFIQRIRQRLNESKEVKRKDNAMSLLNNGFKQAKYYKHQDKVFVVSMDNKLITVVDFDKKKYV